MTFNTFLASWHNLPFNLLTFSNWYVQLGVSLNPCDIIQDLPTTERSACCINFPVFRVGKALFEIPMVHVRAAPLMRFWNSSFFLSPVVWSSKFQRHHPCMGKKVHSTGKKSFFWASLMQNRLKIPNKTLVFGFPKNKVIFGCRGSSLLCGAQNLKMDFFQFKALFCGSTPPGKEFDL